MAGGGAIGGGIAGGGAAKVTAAGCDGGGILRITVDAAAEAMVAREGGAPTVEGGAVNTGLFDVVGAAWGCTCCSTAASSAWNAANSASRSAIILHTEKGLELLCVNLGVWCFRCHFGQERLIVRPCIQCMALGTSMQTPIKADYGCVGLISWRMSRQRAVK